MTPQSFSSRGLRTSPGGRFLAALLLVTVVGCSAPTQGPTIRIGPNGWVADPASTVQEGDVFEFTIENRLDVPVHFAVLRLDYGEPTDLPLVDGVVDVSRQVVYESADPRDPGDPVVAYNIVHPVFAGEGAAPRPGMLDANATTTLRVGNPGLGGGEPGRFVVISYEPGGLERGDFAVFDMTDESGNVPQFTVEDFYPSDQPEP